MNYKIKEYPEIVITGHSRIFNGAPIEKQQQQHDFMVDGNVRFIRYALQGMAADCNTEYCVVSDVSDDSFRFTIGSVIPEYFTTHLAKTVGNYAEKLNVVKIPTHTYVHAETVRGTQFMDNQAELYRQLVKEWLPSSGYVLSNSPEIAIVHKYNDDKNNCYVELLIPIEKQ